MPQTVWVVVANVGGSEYPSGGAVFRTVAERDVFIKKVRAMRGFVDLRVEEGAAPTESYVVTANVGGSEYPAGGKVFGTLDAARNHAARLHDLNGLHGWKIERAQDGAYATVDQWWADQPPPAPRVNLAESNADNVFDAPAPARPRQPRTARGR